MTNPNWYLTMDIATLIVSSVAVFISFVFLIAVAIHRRQCHSVANLITCNTQLSIFLIGCTFLSAMSNVLRSDLHNGDAFDSLCIWRCFLVYVGTAIIYHTFATQAYYSYARVVYSAQPKLSSFRMILMIMAIQWFVTVAVMLILPLTGQIEYQIDSQMCNIRLTRYAVIWCMVGFIYIPPYTIIHYVYVRLVIFLKQSRIRAAAVSTNNVRRELKMIQRMILVLFILSVSGGPFLIFIILAAINNDIVPSYYTRIICLFVVITILLASSILFIHNTDVRQALFGYINRNKHGVQPVVAYVQTRHTWKTKFFTRVVPIPQHLPRLALAIPVKIPKTAVAPLDLNTRKMC